METERSNTTKLLIDMRAIFGISAGFAYAGGSFLLGAVFFLCGLFLKLIDLPYAKLIGDLVPADDKEYRISAIIFNGSAFAGLLYGLGTLAYAGKTPWISPIFLLALPAVLMSVSLLGKWIPWVRPHSAFAKIRSGLISLPIAVFPIAAHYSPAMHVLVLISAILIVAVVVHKGSY